MRGLTPVIAVILLMLITISMVGFAFVWLSRVATTAGTQIDEQTMNTISSAAKKVKIDDIVSGSVTVRNIGSASVGVDEIAVFVNNAMRTCTWSNDPVSPGDITTCTLSPGCNPADVVKITSPGNSDEVLCS